MKYYGENVNMVYHKVNDIPKIWLSVLSLIWYFMAIIAYNLTVSPRIDLKQIKAHQ